MVRANIFFRLGLGGEMRPTDQPQSTATAKPPSTQERRLLSSGCKILEQTSGSYSLVTLSIYLQNSWTVNGPKPSLQHPVISVPIH